MWNLTPNKGLIIGWHECSRKHIFFSFFYLAFDWTHSLENPRRKDRGGGWGNNSKFLHIGQDLLHIYRGKHLKPVYSRWISIFFELCRQAFVLMHTGRPEWLFDIRFVYTLFPLCITLLRGIATSHFLRPHRLHFALDRKPLSDNKYLKIILFSSMC